MTVYQPSIDADLLLLNWYYTMATCEDFEMVFSSELAPCSSFMASMRSCTLIYEVDEKGIWFAAWFDRVMCAGAYGFWVRADKRDSPGGGEPLRAALESLRFGLSRFPVLLFVTKQPEIVTLSLRVGFVPLGDIPWLFDGESASVAWLDAARFNQYNPAPHVEAFVPENATPPVEELHG